MTRPIDYNLQLDGFVLVGGVSSRMGHDKAQMILGGKRLYERAAAALNEICGSSISLVGGRGGHPAASIEGDIAVLPDIAAPDLPRAAIVGLYTALAKAKAPWIAVLACDLPFVTGELMTKLSGFCSDEFDAVVPVQQDARPQPLCAFYRCERCLPVAEEMLKKGDLKLRRFLSRISTHYIPFDRIEDIDGSEHFFRNINKPEDYESARRISRA